jgi:hypothetical protein
MSAHRWHFVAGAVVLLSGCRPAARAPTSDPDTATASPAGPPKADPAPVPAAEACAGGERWDGSPDACDYVHEGCCYPDPRSLCAAAGCEAERCRILESHPAQARCEP